MLVGVRIREIFSNKSSLNDLALLANLVPLRLFLCPDDPVVPPLWLLRVAALLLLPPPTSGVLVCWVGVAGDGVLGLPYRFDCDDREEFGVDGVLMTLSVTTA